MAGRYLSAEEVLRRVLDDDSDRDYSDESEVELSEEDDSNGRPEHEESEEGESDEILSDDESSDEPGMFYFSVLSFRFCMCNLPVFTSHC